MKNIIKITNWLVLSLFLLTCKPQDITLDSPMPCTPTDSINIVDSIRYITKYKTIVTYKEVYKPIYDTVTYTVTDTNTIIVEELYSLNIDSITEYTPCVNTIDTVYIKKCGVLCKIFKKK